MINVIVKPNTIELPAGAVVRIPGTWQDYQVLLKQLGDNTSPRVKYRNGELLLMVPLPEHGKQLDIIVEMVRVLLRHQGLTFDSYHETTMELPDRSGVIPDHFFCGFDLNAILTDCINDAYKLGSGAIDKLSDRYPRKR